MTITKIQKQLFVSRECIDDITSSGSFQEKSELSCIWSMFSAIYRYSTTKTGKYVEELPLSFHN